MKKIPFGKPNINKKEKKEVNNVLSGPILVHGKKIIIQLTKKILNLGGIKLMNGKK